MRKISLGAVATVAAVGLLASLSSAGSSTPTCFGKPADHVLSNGHDDLELSSETEPQVVVALAGDDSITGGEAGDRICSGPGIDEVYGETGKDRINSGGEIDYATGEGGNDLVKGGDGAERGHTTWRVGTPDQGPFGAGLDGGEGNDTVRGGRGGDEIDGEGGDDMVIGDKGTDFCRGGPGDDTVDCEKGFADA